MMNLYKILQDINCEFETYDSAVVAATTEKEAQNMHPEGGTLKELAGDWVRVDQREYVTVEFLGKAETGTNKGVIVASYNAG